MPSLPSSQAFSPENGNPSCEKVELQLAGAGAMAAAEADSKPEMGLIVPKRNVSDLSSLFDRLSLEKSANPPSHMVEVRFCNALPTADEIKAHILAKSKIHASTYSIVDPDAEACRITLVFNTLASAASFVNANMLSSTADAGQIAATSCSTRPTGCDHIGESRSNLTTDVMEPAAATLSIPPPYSLMVKSATYVTKASRPVDRPRTCAVASRMIKHALSRAPK
ncbi:hypothetical protein MDAP_002132 [Mitosporidium daphniae]|uniref:Uncharacterized protein n=1 Tax=Mitosporidium daphniae TaxID=1485682 RepID=A0A098VTZ8_9MICR|nr:uncharacterized protein DI09_18p100 [Mitosporidium daphniae]KGG52304.1 hypothetical protein DI09_18p100 [Mitosporidium daphniae]|eukprot:XP_013238731.1 uncharacterized protein DI09_18p100 [Mitosporidium daphniae]